VNISNDLNHQNNNFHVSKDGYIRIREESLAIVHMEHLDSGLFSTHDDDYTKESSTCIVCGYTEWHSKTQPSISIGWDWKLNNLKEPLAYEIVGEPFSNILLQDEAFEDLSMDVNLKRISDIIKSRGWNNALESLITQKYQ